MIPVQLALIVAVAYLVVWMIVRGGPPLFHGRPEAPDWDDELAEVIQMQSHIAWHRANRKPRPCDLCESLGKKAEKAQRAHEMGLRRTP